MDNQIIGLGNVRPIKLSIDSRDAHVPTANLEIIRGAS